MLISSIQDANRQATTRIHGFRFCLLASCEGRAECPSFRNLPMAGPGRKRCFQTGPPAHWNWRISLTYSGLEMPIRQEIRQKTSRGRPGFCRWWDQEPGIGVPIRSWRCYRSEIRRAEPVVFRGNHPFSGHFRPKITVDCRKLPVDCGKSVLDPPRRGDFGARFFR